MKTILISSTGTEIGKTFVARQLVKQISNLGFKTQVIKVVETGVEDDEEKDVQYITKGLRTDLLSAETLFRFKYPMAPVDAACLEGKELSYSVITDRINNLSQDFDFRVIEGAGGIAVPMDSDASKDWLALACDLKVDLLLLVVKEELGAINQTRMIYRYCKDACEQVKIPISIFLNQHQLPPQELIDSHERTLNSCDIPWTRDITMILERSLIPKKSLLQ